MQMHCKLFQSTLDKPSRAHSCLDHVFLVSLIYMTPLVGNQGIIVNVQHFYSR